MRRVLMQLLAAVLLIGASVTDRARADEPADAIQSVIDRQIKAFLASDLDQAFTFASPMIQKQFGDPSNFGRMVQRGYPMVWRPARYEMLQLVETGAGLVQVVLIEDASGQLHEAGYLMQQIDGKWRINGVHVRVRPGVGT